MQQSVVLSHPIWVDKIQPRRKRRRGAKKVLSKKLPAPPKRIQSQDSKRLETRPVNTILDNFDPETESFHQLRIQALNSVALASELELGEARDSESFRRVTNVFVTLEFVRGPFWRNVCDRIKRDNESKRRKVSELPLGPVTYSLRRPLSACLRRLTNHQWQYFLEGSEPQFVGIGDSISDARSDFLGRIHTAFQSLVSLRPFEMNATQTHEWKLLERMIDVEKYWDSKPLTLVETGVVSDDLSRERVVIWLDGDRHELISLHQAIPEFAALKKGEWFEALVERDPKSYVLRKVRYVKPIPPIIPMDENATKEWIDGLPSGSHLLESDTDWAKL
jgi:hypothetical protein